MDERKEGGEGNFDSIGAQRPPFDPMPISSHRARKAWTSTNRAAWLVGCSEICRSFTLRRLARRVVLLKGCDKELAKFSERPFHRSMRWVSMTFQAVNEAVLNAQ